jgi:DNA mismatch repair protein MutL
MPESAAQTPSTIHILPAQLANQIAAGEVVERPASVVKELVENCLDANANEIQIEIEQGGHKRILVRDNGSGIAKEQLELALSRHATSKIQNIDDLENISSMGFRGEALASISSVSRLTLTSKPDAQATAWQAKAEGLDMAVTLSPAAHPKGTSIEVVDLFFNTPARRKFLRAHKTEFQHIEQTVRRIALAYPAIAFSLKHNGKIVHKLPAGTIENRISALCGSAFLQSAAPLEYRYQDISLHGWCCGIGDGQITTEHQYVFVNQRVIRDKLVMHAIRQAYEGMLEDNTYPAYVLFLNLPAHDMDINVHPAKHEVRFHQARQVHDLIFQAVGQAILQHQQQIEHSGDERSKSKHTTSIDDIQPAHDYIRPLQQASPPRVSDHSPAMQSTSQARTKSAYSPPNSRVNVAESGFAYQQLMTPSNSENALTFVNQGEYLIVQLQDNLTLLPLAALYAYVFEQQLNHSSTPQPLLMPVSVALPDVLEPNLVQVLGQAGFVVERTAKKLRLKEVPSALRALPWTPLFTKLVERTPKDVNKRTLLRALGSYCIELNMPTRAEINVKLRQLEQSAIDEMLSNEGIEISAEALERLSKPSHGVSS